MSFLVAELQASVCPPLAGKPQNSRRVRKTNSAERRFPGARFFAACASAKYSSVRSTGRSPPMSEEIGLIGGFTSAAFQQPLPETLSPKHRRFRPAARSSSSKCLECAPADSKMPACICLRRMGAKDRRPEIAPGQRTTPLRRVKSGPRIAVKMIDRPSPMENLPGGGGIFPRNAQNHVEELVQAKRLLHDRRTVLLPAFFFRITDRNDSQRHDASIREQDSKSI